MPAALEGMRCQSSFSSMLWRPSRFSPWYALFAHRHTHQHICRQGHGLRRSARRSQECLLLRTLAPRTTWEAYKDPDMTSSGPEEVLRLGCEEAPQALRSVSARKGRANSQDALYPFRHLAGQTGVGVNTWILAWQALVLS